MPWTARSPWTRYAFPRAAMTRYSQLGGLKQQNFVSHRSGGQNSENKVSERTHSPQRLWRKILLSIPASGSKRQALLVYRSNFRLCFSLHMATSSVRLCPHFLLLTSTQLKVYPTPLWSHLNGLYLQQPYFHIRSCSEVRTSTCLLGVTDFNPWQALFFHLLSWQTWRKEGQFF